MKQFLVNLFFLIVFNCIHTQTQPRLVLPVGHTEGLNSAVFSPDGKLALTVSDDSTARVFEVATGKELQVFRGHTNSLNSAVFSPDGKLALTVSDDNTGRILNVSLNRELYLINHENIEQSFFYSEC